MEQVDAEGNNKYTRLMMEQKGFVLDSLKAQISQVALPNKLNFGVKRVVRQVVDIEIQY